MAKIHQEMSELLDKQVNALKEKIFRGSRKLLQAHEKVCDENEGRKKQEKNGTHVKNVFNERKWFISHTRGTGEMHRYEALVNDS